MGWARTSLVVLARVLLCHISGLVPGTSSGHAQGQAQGRVVTDLKMPSTRLGRPIPYVVYLPTQPSSIVAGERGVLVKQRLPVLYLLHGHGDTELAWLKLGRIAETLGRLIASGALNPLIVVMPMGDNSWYVDDARGDGFGPVFSALVGDLVDGIDARYATLGCREGRAFNGAIAGLLARGWR